MPVNVAAIRPDIVDAAPGVPLIGVVRASEDIAVNNTGSLIAENGEVFRITSTESLPVKVALGSSPDASATVATSATNAAFTLLSDSVEYVSPAPGDLVAVSA